MPDRRNRSFRPRSTSWGSPEFPESIDESSTSVDLEALVASALAEGPEHLLGLANDIIIGCADCATDAVLVVLPDDSRERRALAVALGVVLGVEPADPAVLGGLPSWLATLPQATVRSVRRRRNGASWCHLIEVGNPEHRLVTAQVVLSEHGEITNGFVVDESIDELEKLMRMVGPERGRSFNTVKLDTVAPTLLAGFARRRLGWAARQPESSWPDNEPLITWVVRLVVHASERRDRNVERYELD